LPARIRAGREFSGLLLDSARNTGGFMTLQEWCFPAQARRVPWARGISVSLRALHLAGVALLLGGHAYGAPPDALFPWLVVAALTGAGLIVPEVLTWGLYWFALGKGVSVVAKLALLLAIPFFWEARVPILVTALLLAGVTSHMPARLRHYSFLHRRALTPADPLSGIPGAARPSAPLRRITSAPCADHGKLPAPPHKVE
jgi:hypothetical protein